MTELHNVWTDQELLRRDLLDALLAGDGESEAVRRLAQLAAAAAVLELFRRDRADRRTGR